MDHATEFLHAVQADDRPRAGALLDQDPSLAFARGPGGASPLLLAMLRDAHEVAALLLTRGAPVGFFEAAALGRSERLRDLLREDPTLLQARTAEGLTGLHVAARFGRAEAARCLLARGADALARDALGRTPSELAEDLGHRRLAEDLRATAPMA